jgi:hypothetical protein
MFFRHPADAAGFDDASFNRRAREGDSGLVIPAGPMTIVIEQPEVDGGELRITLHPNAAGRLSHASAELTSEDIFTAKGIVSANVGAYLSRLAFETGAQVVLHWVETTDLNTGYSDVAFLFRGTGTRIASWPGWTRHPNDFFRAAFAVYREGLNSTSAYWALVCFYRVIHGAKQYAARQSAYARTKGTTPERPKAVLVADPMIGSPFEDWIGRSASHVAALLNAQYRVPVVHGVNPEEPVQAADQINIENRYWLARPVAQQLARTLLQIEWDFRTRLGAAHIPELDETEFS